MNSNHCRWDCGNKLRLKVEMGTGNVYSYAGTAPKANKEVIVIIYGMQVNIKFLDLGLWIALMIQDM